jgi:hypothetical protein
MALNPREERLETIVLRSPEKSLPVLGVIAMSSAAVFEESAVVKKSLAADPTHHRRGRYRKSQVLDRLFNTALQSSPIRRHLVRRELNVFPALILWKVGLSSGAFKIRQQSMERSKGHWAPLLRLPSDEHMMVQS